MLSIADALEHPQAEALGALKPIGYPGRDGSVPVADLPLHLSRTSGGITAPPPAPGEHNREILEAAGYDAEAIAGFERDGVI